MLLMKTLLEKYDIQHFLGPTGIRFYLQIHIINPVTVRLDQEFACSCPFATPVKVIVVVENDGE